MRCKPANRVLVALVMGLTVLLSTSQLLAKTHITVLCNWYNVPQQLEIWPQLVAGFNDSQTAIEAEYIPGDGSIDKLKTMIVAGSAPDAVHFDRYRVIELVNDGLLLPVDAYLPPGVNLRTDFIPSTIQEAMWQGRIYALPSSTDIRGLFWNQDLVDAAGLPSSTGPRTWDEVGVYARKLTRFDQANLPVQLGFVPWWGNWGWQGWFWHFGGDYYDYGTNTPTVNRPENVAALSWMQSYAEEYGTPSIFSAAGMTENSHILMAKGKLAMDVAHYGAASGWYLLTTPGLRFWGGHMPQPPGGRNGTWSGGMSFVIPKGTKQPEAAGRFLAYMAQPETQARFHQVTRALPANRKALPLIAGSLEPLERIFIEQLDVANWRRPFTGVISSAVGTAQDDVINLRKAPRQALDEAQEKLIKQYPQLWGN